MLYPEHQTSVELPGVFSIGEVKYMVNYASKIFGIGLSKTGTTSLFAALHILGYRSGTYRHMEKLRMERWFHGNFNHDYFKDYDALTDLPLPNLYAALDEIYMGSRFILTVRKMDAWLDSCRRHWERHGNRTELDFANLTNLSTYGIYDYNETVFKHKYLSHEMAVLKYFEHRPNDLLVMDISGGDGWNQLCEFLHLPEPDEAFPHAQPGFIPEGMID